MNLIKRIKNNLLYFILGVIVTSGIGITIAYQINASQISYGDTDVANAITELYGMSDTYINYSKGANGGEAILLDPTGENETCTTSDSTLENKAGCMKFYIYAEDKNNYYAILDHNTTAFIKPCADNNCWLQAQTQVLIDTIAWKPEYQARNITADELWNITKSTNGRTNWLSSKSSDSDNFYFDGKVKSSTDKSKYTFLFDYTYGCDYFGCNNQELGMYDASKNEFVNGYWTGNLTAKQSNKAWRVSRNGRLNIGQLNEATNGVRPVITIAK